MKSEIDIPSGFQALTSDFTGTLPGNVAVKENYSNAPGDRARAAAKRLKEAAERALRATREAAERAAQAARIAAEKAQKAAEEAAKKGTKAAKDAAKKAENAAKKAAGKAKKAGSKVRKFKKPFARFNPRNASSRAAALVAFRSNSFGVSSRLAPAFINDSKFKPDAKAKALPKWAKVKKYWENLGGKTDKLQEAIRKGYKVAPVKNLASKVGFKKFSKAEGDESFSEVPEEAQGGLEGMPIIGSIIKLLKGLFNPFTSGTPDGLDLAIDDGEDFSTDEDIPDVDADGNPIDPETGEPIEREEILGIPKTAFWAIVGTIAATGITVTIALVMKSKKGKSAAIPKV